MAPSLVQKLERGAESTAHRAHLGTLLATFRAGIGRHHPQTASALRKLQQSTRNWRSLRLWRRAASSAAAGAELALARGRAQILLHRREAAESPLLSKCQTRKREALKRSPRRGQREKRGCCFQRWGTSAVPRLELR